MLDRGIGIIGLALAVIAIFAPYRYPKMPSWAVHTGLSIGVLLIGLAAGLIIADRRNDEEAQQVSTDLKIEFFGDQRIPRELHQENIATWYTLWSPSAVLVQRDNEGRDIERHEIVPKTWNIFITFSKITKYRQLIVSSYADLPPYEVRQSGPKFAIIQILGDVPKGILEIYAQS